MPKTDINTILKKGGKTKIVKVDYGTLKNIEKLKKLQKQAKVIQSNKTPSDYKLSKIIIK